jgi:hypothetical protein
MNSIVEQIDRALEGKKKSEKIIMFSMPLIVFCTLSYTYLFPISEDSLTQSKRALQVVKSQINTQKIYLNSLNITDIDNFDRDAKREEITLRYKDEITKIKLEIENIDDERIYIRNKLLELTSNQNKWSDFLDFVANRANELDLNIKEIENERYTNITNSDIFKDLNIKVNGSGTFQNLLKYINDIENYGVFVELNNTALVVKDGNLTFSLDVNNWRVKL